MKTIYKQKTENYLYVFDFPYDSNIVDFCREIKAIYGWQDFGFDYENKKWRFCNIEIVEKILKQYPDTSVMQNMQEDIEATRELKAPVESVCNVSNKKGFKLRPYQKEAVEKVLSSLKLGLLGNDLVVLPTAAGKSICIAEIAYTLKRPILIIQPTREILTQNKEKLLKYVDESKIGVYSASMNEKTIKLFTLATIGSIYKKPKLFAHFEMIIIDECFIVGTKVDGKNIEDIAVGDYVNSFNHRKNIIENKKVLAVKKRWYEGNLTNINNGLIISTYNHPIFVEGSGYVGAYKLNKGDKLYVKSNLSSVQNRNEERNVSSSSSIEEMAKMELYPIQNEKKRSSFLQFKLCKSILCKKFFRKNEEKQSDEKEKLTAENGSDSQADGTQTKITRREWERNDCLSKKITRNTWGWMVSRVNCCNWKRIFTISLQNRFRESIKKDSSRSRWCFSLFSNFSEKRQEKRRFVNVKRVESIQSYEQRHNGECKKGCWVYNLEIEGNNNYFANDVLVHNCHLLNPANLTGMFSSFIKKVNAERLELMNKPPMKVIGFTATPYRMSTGYFSLGNGFFESFATIKIINRIKGKANRTFWSRILININVADLIEQGYLCKLEYTDASIIDHVDIPLNKSGTSFDLDAFEEKISDKEKKILKIIEHAKSISKSVLVFNSSVRQAEKFSSLVESSRVVTANTPADERTQIVEDFKDHKIKVIFNVGVFTIGFDHPSLDCIVVLRPTRSIGLHTQMLGRGLRIAEGKKSCRIIDLTSNVKHLGRVETIKLVQRNGLWELESETKENWHGIELYHHRFKKKTKEKIIK